MSFSSAVCLPRICMFVYIIPVLSFVNGTLLSTCYHDLSWGNNQVLAALPCMIVWDDQCHMRWENVLVSYLRSSLTFIYPVPAFLNINLHTGSWYSLSEIYFSGPTFLPTKLCHRCGANKMFRYQTHTYRLYRSWLTCNLFQKVYILKLRLLHYNSSQYDLLLET